MNRQLDPKLTQELRAILDERLLVDVASLHVYQCDALTHFKIKPLAVCIPINTQEVSRVVRACYDAGVPVTVGARGYRPTVDLPDVTAKLLKPQNIVEMLDLGTRDLGFAGADWVAEKDADLVEVLDCGLNPVRIVAAVPEDAAWPLPYSPPTRRGAMQSRRRNASGLPARNPGPDGRGACKNS